MALWERRDRAYDNEVAHSPKESGTGDRRRKRQREREKRSINRRSNMELYKGGRGARMQGSRGKEKRKERKGQRRATPTTTSMGEGKATKRDDFFRILLPSNRPTLPPFSLSLSPNAERNNSPRGGRGLKSAATESPIIFRSLSFPPNQRIKASLRGPASISPPLPRSFLVRSTKEEEGETTVGWTNLCFSWIPFFSRAGSWIVSILRGRGIEERRKLGEIFFRWKVALNDDHCHCNFSVAISFRLSFGGIFRSTDLGKKMKRIIGSCKRNRSIDRFFSFFSRVGLDWRINRDNYYSFIYT